MAPQLDILCLSHLPWERRLFQRPQQIMLELARRGHRVFYVGCVGIRRYLDRHGTREYTGREAIGAGGVLQHVTSSFSPFSRRLTTTRTAVAARNLRRRMAGLFQGRAPIIWLYHPSLLELGQMLSDGPVVFDCMDQFSAFQQSSPGLRQAEEKTLATAKVLFAGGRSLCRSVVSALERYSIGKEVHCLPSGVDLEHFAAAMLESTALPADLAEVRHPLLGYFGAVDERIDFELLAGVCRARPEWSVVLVGPVLCEQKALPENLLLPGGRTYDVLPRYLKAFDVCMMPFVQSELVAHISPTKTPEYLAGGKPVVSTPVPDVVEEYGGVVRIASGVTEFADACESALAAATPPHVFAAEASRRARTWRQIAEEMEHQLLEAM